MKNKFTISTTQNVRVSDEEENVLTIVWEFRDKLSSSEFKTGKYELLQEAIKKIMEAENLSGALGLMEEGER